MPEESKSSIKGACLCGKVAYEIDGQISKIWLCHCSKCRRATGSAFHSSAVCRPDKFRWLRGEEEISEYENSPGYKVRFCRHCGSPVPSFLEENQAMFLHVGALDGEFISKLSHHIFVGSKAEWFELHDELPKHAEHVGKGEGSH